MFISRLLIIPTETIGQTYRKCPIYVSFSLILTTIKVIPNQMLFKRALLITACGYGVVTTYKSTKPCNNELSINKIIHKWALNEFINSLSQSMLSAGQFHYIVIRSAWK